jgi:hypothetical protein
VYDPTIGRLLQADVVVRAPPGQILSYNRYGYVWNNPKGYTDPSGYFRGCPADDGDIGASPVDDGTKDSSPNPARAKGDGNSNEGDANLNKEMGQEASGNGVVISPDAQEGGYPAGGEFDTGKKWPPLAPEGADIDANITEAEGRWSPWWFRDQVKNKGPWDFKQHGKSLEDFGNFHYGAVGAAFGFPDSVLLNEAGRAQEAAGTSLSTWGDSGPSLLPFLGSGSYGDDPSDQYFIQQGIDYYNNRDQWHTPVQLGP